jgi:hypothetical protein
MPLPASLHGNEYWNNLSALRNEALVKSHTYGKRWRIGRIAFGRAQAQWQTEVGGTAYLEDRGLQIGDTTLLNFHPTTLQIFDGYGSNGIGVTSLSMDIDDIGDIEVYRYMITTDSFLGAFSEVVRNEMSKRADRRHEMAVPTDQQLALVYTEMERGASGLYAPQLQPPQET